MSHTERVVVLVDMDCFYCQVEEKLNPKLQGKPIAVVQYKAWRGGGIIAVNYPARDKGVTRYMRGNEAKQKCPEIVLARVPEVRGKADLTKYRNAGKQVAEVLQTFTNLLERASVDEAYLDITEAVKMRLEQGLDHIQIEKLANTFVVGCDTINFIKSLKENNEFSESNIKLAIGAIITEEIRAEVFKKTGYKCSAGVAHNKILAKLVCGLHKPNKQTLLPQNSVSELYKDLPIKKIKSLGGKFGSALAEELQITYMGELGKFSEKELAKKFDEKNAKWLYNIARGIDLESVTVRLISKSIGCCKRFPGRTALLTSTDVEHWMNELASEISERLNKDLEENNRRAKQMVVSFTQETDGKDISSSRTHPLQSYDQSKIARSALDVIRRFCLRADGSYCITFLGLSVGNFQDLKNSVDITSLFKNMNHNESPRLKPTLQEDKTKNVPSFFQNIAEKTKNLNISSSSDPNKSREEEETSNKEVLDSKPKSFFQSSSARYQEPSTSKAASSIETSNSDRSLKEKPSADQEEKEDSLKSSLKSKSFFQSWATRYQEPSTSKATSSTEPSNLEVPLGSKPSLREKPSTDQEEKENVNKAEKVEPNGPITKSFFLNYFMTEGKHLLKRNSNTTEPEKNLDLWKTYKETSQDAPSRQEDNSSSVQSTSPNDVETCPDCNKKIKISNYVSHLDYHFALKMVKEEAHLYKEPKVNLEKQPKSVSKAKEPRRVLTLLQKSKKDELDETNSQLCAECNKRIRISDLSRHFDKHEEENKFASQKNHYPISKIKNTAREPNSMNPMEFEHIQSEDHVFLGVTVNKTVSEDSVHDSVLQTHKKGIYVRKDMFEIAPFRKSPVETNYGKPGRTETYKMDFEEPSSTCEPNGSTKILPAKESPIISKYADADADLFSDGSPPDNGNVSPSKQDTEETDNLSVYSADTEDLNEDTKNLIYFEDVFSESDSSQLLFKSQETREGTVRKNDEENIFEAGSCRTSVVKDAFLELDFDQPHFKELAKENPTCSKGTILNDNSNEPKEGIRSTLKSLFDTENMDVGEMEEPKDHMEMVPEVDGNQVCPECNKKILSSEYLSHMDYHFALKMVKDEAYLYKNPGVPKEEKSSKTSNIRSKAAQASKRKLPESKKIETFLQKHSDENLNEKNSEMCNECNKRIKLDETLDHADYHAAKKLHSELNSPKKAMTASVKVKSKKNKSVMNMRSISNFFKA